MIAILSVAPKPTPSKNVIILPPFKVVAMAVVQAAMTTDIHVDRPILA